MHMFWVMVVYRWRSIKNFQSKGSSIFFINTRKRQQFFRLYVLSSTDLECLVWYSASQNFKFIRAFHIALWKFAQSISFIKASFFGWRKQIKPSYWNQFLVNRSLSFLRSLGFSHLNVSVCFLQSCFLFFCRFKTSFVPGIFSFWKYLKDVSLVLMFCIDCA